MHAEREREKGVEDHKLLEQRVYLTCARTVEREIALSLPFKNFTHYRSSDSATTLQVDPSFRQFTAGIHENYPITPVSRLSLPAVHLSRRSSLLFLPSLFLSLLRHFMDDGRRLWIGSGRIDQVTDD